MQQLDDAKALDQAMKGAAFEADDLFSPPMFPSGKAKRNINKAKTPPKHKRAQDPGSCKSPSKTNKKRKH